MRFDAAMLGELRKRSQSLGSVIAREKSRESFRQEDLGEKSLTRMV